ncbi:MAG: cell division protein FtsZ [Bacteroidales bacterium]|nr:cell division protein FtsZ [Bacteroidales bacterium]
MDEYYTNTQQDVPFKPVNAEIPNYIKVIGVGGGGGNAVSHMMEEGITGVDFILCNTDYQALMKSGVKTKVHLGKRELGAGNDPNKGREAAEMSKDEISALLDENTKMLFVTAGMGGGTGTGGAPVIAKIAKDKGILTVGIVTLPMEREGRRRKMQALSGIEELKKCVDALILISTDKLRDQYGNLKLSEAFHKADDVLTTAAKGIAEIITVPGLVNVDFEDVKTVMKDSGKAIMGAGTAEGEGRAEKAIKAAIHSPLLNDSNIEGAQNILLYITSGTDEVTMDEVDEILEIAQASCGNNSDVIWGNGTDENLGEALCVTLIATGFNHEQSLVTKTAEKTYGPVEKTQNGEKRIYDLSGKVVSNAPETPAMQEKAPEETPAAPISIAASELMETKPAPPKPEQTRPAHEDKIIKHTLFGLEEDEIETEPKTETPTHQFVAPEPMRPTFEPQPDPKPTVKVFQNPFRKDNDDEGFEITSRIMTKEEITAKAAQEVAILETKKAKESDPKEELKRQRLRALSMNFRTQRGLEELENQPAYLRRNVDINDSNLDNDMSHYATSQNGISGENTFLHDNVD